MSIYNNGKEISVQEFFDKMQEILNIHYKMDFSKMESSINIDDVFKEFEKFTIVEKFKKHKL